MGMRSLQGFNCGPAVLTTISTGEAPDISSLILQAWHPWRLSSGRQTQSRLPWHLFHARSRTIQSVMSHDQYCTTYLSVHVGASQIYVQYTTVRYTFEYIISILLSPTAFKCTIIPVCYRWAPSFRLARPAPPSPRTVNGASFLKPGGRVCHIPAALSCLHTAAARIGLLCGGSKGRGKMLSAHMWSREKCPGTHRFFRFSILEILLPGML